MSEDVDAWLGEYRGYPGSDTRDNPLKVNGGDEVVVEITAGLSRR